MPGDQLDRDDLIRGLNAVIAKLRAAGQPAGIRIVGGAALALRYFDRRTTADIDAHLLPEEPTLQAAVEVALERGWPTDWLNSSAAIFIPAYGADPEWEILHSDDDITVEVASPVRCWHEAQRVEAWKRRAGHRQSPGDLQYSERPGGRGFA